MTASLVLLSCFVFILLLLTQRLNETKFHNKKQITDIQDFV